MYEYFEILLKKHGIKASTVSKETNIPYSTFSDWKAGRYTPKIEKLQKIADYFGVSVEYFYTGKNDPINSNSGKTYYFDDDTAAKAQELFDNPDLRMLFDAARDCRPEDLQMAAEMLKRFKETNPDG